MKVISRVAASSACPDCLGIGVVHGSSSMTSWIHTCGTCNGRGVRKRFLSDDECVTALKSLIRVGHRFILHAGESLEVIEGIIGTSPCELDWSRYFTPFPAT
jgi:hypothetical protein